MDQKRKRTVLSIEQKLKIIEKYERGQSVKSLKEEYGVGDQTIRDIVKKKSDLLKFACSSDSSSGMKNRKTMKKSSYDDLDRALLEWFNNQRAQGNPVSGPICSEKAKFFFEALGLEGNFDASSGWLTRFKQRHGIRELDIRGEILSGDNSAAENFCKEFNEFVSRENLLPEQIYNADETGLFWKCLPSKTLAAENERSAPGHKVSKERLTLMCCSNATGTHKVKLFVVGKSKKPRSFKGTRAVNMPVDYSNQKKGWMNKEICHDWFHNKFCPSVRQFLKSKGLPEKAVLLLDNAPSHPDELLLKSENGNIFVKYLPPNVTALIQPMDQGVIASLKRNYRSSVLRKFIEEGNDLKTFFKNFSILDAIYEAAAAWDKVKFSTLAKSWRKIIPDIPLEDDFCGFEDDNNMAQELAQLANTVPGGEQVDANDIAQWFDVDAQLSAFQCLSDNDIVMRAQGQAESDSDSSDEEGGGEGSSGHVTQQPTVTHGTALTYVEGLLDYLDGQEDTLLCDTMVLRKIRSAILKKEAKAKKQKTLNDFFRPV